MLKTKEIFDRLAPERDTWKNKNKYYYQELEHLFSSIIPPEKKVLEIGCGTGDLLNAVKPSKGVGIDFSKEMIKIAEKKYTRFTFKVCEAENLRIDEKFDYIIMSDLLGHLFDIWMVFNRLEKICNPDTRVVISFFNYLWEPVLKIGERFRMKMPDRVQNWVSVNDVDNLLSLNDFEIEKNGSLLLLPKEVPVLSKFFNRYLIKVPVIKNFCLVQYLVAKPMKALSSSKNLSCSVIVPCRNEFGNIEGCVERIPDMGRHTEIIFVDGESTDGTRQKIKEMIEKYRGKRDIKFIPQVPNLGKGDAVKIGFNAASGDVLMILDADMTVPPEDLNKFFLPLAEGKAEFVNGSRLVYPLEDEAMRGINLVGNKIFSLIFTWLLGQRVKDTLCGTKVLFKKDFYKIKMDRDPFGDFDLLFGAAKNDLKIVEMPIRYRRRVAGMSKIKIFKHGLLLVKNCFVGFRELKLHKWLKILRGKNEFKK